MEIWNLGAACRGALVAHLIFHPSRATEASSSVSRKNLAMPPKRGKGGKGKGGKGGKAAEPPVKKRKVTVVNVDEAEAAEAAAEAAAAEAEAVEAAEAAAAVEAFEAAAAEAAAPAPAAAVRHLAKRLESLSATAKKGANVHFSSVHQNCIKTASNLHYVYADTSA